MRNTSKEKNSFIPLTGSISKFREDLVNTNRYNIVILKLQELGNFKIVKKIRRSTGCNNFMKTQEQKFLEL